MPHISDAELIQQTHNTSRYFVEHRQIAWAVLLGVVGWGVFGYFSMPQRKDPEIPVRVAVASCQWPGATAQEVEQLITRPIEQTIAQNKTIHPAGADDYGIRSISLPGASFVYVQLSEDTKDSREQFSDINLKLQALGPRLPSGATSVQFQSDFGDTAALMMTVASPAVDDLAIDMRARSVEDAIRAARSAARPSSLQPVTIIYTFPLALSETALAEAAEGFRRSAERDSMIEQGKLVAGRGFIGVDGVTKYDDEHIAAYVDRYVATNLKESEFDPDISPHVIVRGIEQTREKLAPAAGLKYSHAQLDDYTDLIARSLLGVPQTSRVERNGVLPQAVYLDYSQERLASYGVQVTDLSRVLLARNITLPGGSIEAGGREIQIDPSGQFEDARSIGNVIVGSSGVVGSSSAGPPIYLRDIVRISRAYQSPASYLNFYTWFDKNGQPHRSRAITLAVYMRSGEQIQKFGAAVDEKMKQVRAALPPDLVIARTSDQPLQVKENIDLFMEALYEAIALVVLIALVGFWEWRSALLMALSMPITLAMTFGMAHTAHIDLQQVSIATLIIALGLLVDDPVVANDAIKRGLAAGIPRIHAAWLGPTKLARAILYATATNIIAYLPFLMLTGSTGDFLYSLPIVMTAALISSRLVSMTFIPLLGYYLLRPAKRPEPTIEDRRQRGFYGMYYRLAGKAIQWRWAVLALSVLFLAGGGMIATKLKSQFFPEDVQYWSYVDVWLPNDAPLSLTNDTSQHVESIARRVIKEYEQTHSPKGSPALLESVTTFVGGGGPRFWFSVSPEQQQRNYAQVLIRLSEKEATPRVIAQLQSTLSKEIAGAWVTVHQLQTNPVEFPVEVRVSGTSDVDPKEESTDNERLRMLAGRVQDILRPIRGVQVVQNDWFQESPEVKLKIDSDRANLAGVTNRDVAASTTGAMSGTTVTTLREGNRQIPVIARLRAPERAQLSDVQNLYVYSSQGLEKVPLRTVSSVANEMVTGRIRRQEHFRTIGVHAFPQPGVLPSEILSRAMPQLNAFEKTLPAGYRMEIGGEQAKQEAGFADLAKVLAISILGIYAALLLQFGHAVKPFLVLAATPYGIVGALICLAVMGTPFGFMAFLGIASLIGVIVSHVIVLFDFIEEMHEKGEPFERAIRDAGIERLRPVLITVCATILALFPLASHGGPLWQPLCYAQIGGLAVATFITLLLVPVLYSIAVLDLRIVKWEAKASEAI
jgi:multidrug efflux pump subunit AcrB